MDAHSDDECHRVELRHDSPLNKTDEGMCDPEDHADNDLQDGCMCRDELEKVKGFKHLAKVIEGVQFKGGVEQTEANRDAA